MPSRSPSVMYTSLPMSARLPFVHLRVYVCVYVSICTYTPVQVVCTVTWGSLCLTFSVYVSCGMFGVGLQEIGLLDPEGNLDVDKLRELYGVQPNTYKRARERKEEDERRRCLPRDRVSKQERHQQLKFREAALEMLTNPSDSQQRQGADLRWKEREEDEKIGGKIARATAVFDALLREQFPDYKPITDPYQLGKIDR